MTRPRQCFRSFVAAAHRLVKQFYSISIDNLTTEQIAGKRQKYAGHVSVAVRDPDLRKMVMPYSEATGQKMPLSTTQARIRRQASGAASVAAMPITRSGPQRSLPFWSLEG